MVYKFPELADFFTKDSFSEEELIKLKIKVDSSYPNEIERKAAFNYINLKIIEFKLCEPHELNKKQNQAKVICRDKFYKDNLNLIKKCKTTEDVAEILKINKSILDNIFVKNNLVFDEEIIKLTKETSELYKYILNRLRILYKKEFSSKIKPPSKPASYRDHGSGYSVYDKIAKRGGIGKLIYVRG